MKDPINNSLKERTESIGRMMLGDCNAEPLKMASLTGFDRSHKPNAVLEHGDIYDLLSNPDAEFLVKDAHYSMLVTTGWAAPNNDDHDGAPSTHPDRRRVVVVFGFNKVEQWVSVGFEGDEEMQGCHKGEGMLADAVQDLICRSEKETN